MVHVYAHSDVKGLRFDFVCLAPVRADRASSLALSATSCGTLYCSRVVERDGRRCSHFGSGRFIYDFLNKKTRRIVYVAISI